MGKGDGAAGDVWYLGVCLVGLGRGGWGAWQGEVLGMGDEGLGTQ